MDSNVMQKELEILIFTIRSKKVMIDTDLALLYDVSTKALKQQVKRNIKRFPEDFMFELTINEKNELVTYCDRLSRLKHSSVNPLVFTEQGVAMLSSVLRSEKAILMNIEIMRAFTRYRSILKENEILKKEVQALDEKLNSAVQFLLEQLDELHLQRSLPVKPVGFKYREKK